MGRNVSERSANFDHGSLLATQLGGFRFFSVRFRYEIPSAAVGAACIYPVAANTSWYPYGSFAASGLTSSLQNVST